MRKIHGAWQWHRYLHSNPDFSKIRWWEPEHEERARRAVENRAYFEPLSKKSIVLRCANRYLRRIGVRPTITDWNELVNLICDRMLAHRRTRDACLINRESVKPCTKLKAPRHEEDMPYPAYGGWQVNARLAGMRKRRADFLAPILAEYENSPHPWCEIPSEFDWQYSRHHCPVCGSYIGPVTIHNFRQPGAGATATQTVYCNVWHRSLNRQAIIQVCKRPFCRAVAAYAKSYNPKNPNSLLIGVLNESAKQKGDNPVKRGLAKRHVRHA